MAEKVSVGRVAVVAVFIIVLIYLWVAWLLMLAWGSSHSVTEWPAMTLSYGDALVMTWVIGFVGSLFCGSNRFTNKK